jgi:uncharacterized membrane protein
MAMDLISWGAAAPALGAAFLASIVEVVEAFTIVLVVGTVQGWRPAIIGAGAGLASLTLTVAALGPMLQQIPLHVLQLFIGVLLLLFGMRWLRKAILRSAGIIPLHDETAAFAAGSRALLAESKQQVRLNWIAGVTAFKAVVLEGLEVVFIVIAVGAGRGLLWPASFGALAACALVLAIGLIVRQPLARVPENALKFGVGVMLSAFGVFWTGEGLGINWPGQDAALVAFIGLFLVVSLLAVPAARRVREEHAA